jgi:hypothetical protein
VIDRDQAGKNQTVKTEVSYNRGERGAYMEGSRSRRRDGGEPCVGQL